MSMFGGGRLMTWEILSVYEFLEEVAGGRLYLCGVV